MDEPKTPTMPWIAARAAGAAWHSQLPGSAHHTCLNNKTRTVDFPRLAPFTVVLLLLLLLVQSRWPASHKHNLKPNSFSRLSYPCVRSSCTLCDPVPATNWRRILDFSQLESGGYVVSNPPTLPCSSHGRVVCMVLLWTATQNATVASAR